MDHLSYIEIKNEWGIVVARQSVRTMSKEIGFDAVEQARLATVISELARNIYTYAKMGEICLEMIEDGGRKGIRIIARDYGPGIADVHQVMKDGLAAPSFLGTGILGVRRMMDEFLIESKEGAGTTITVTKWLPERRG